MRSAVFIGLIVITVVELADGARGGSRGGYRSGSRSSGSSSTSNVRYYSGPVYKPSMWRAGTAEGVLFGVLSYKRRSMYTKHPDREPRVCFNDNHLHDETYGYFICPESYMEDDEAYCCGDSSGQSCCTHAEYEEEQKIDYMVWGIVGGIVGVVLLACIVVVCLHYRKKRRAARQAMAAKEIAEQKSELEPPTQGGPTTTPEPKGQDPSVAEGEDPSPPDGCPDPPMPQVEQPDPIGFKNSKDVLPPATGPYPPGPVGFDQPAPGQGGGPMDPNAPPPAYSSI